jgi:hypothetical protein
MTLTQTLRDPCGSGNTVLIQNRRVGITHRTHPRDGVVKTKIHCRAGGDLVA